MLRRTTLIATTLVAVAALGGLILAPGQASASDVFTDVEGASYSPALDALAEEGVINGCGTEEFCPDELLTRGQMATFLSEALDLTPVTGRYFTDIAGTTHEAGISMLAAEGVTQGCTLYEFCPDDQVTRGQFASLLVSAFDVPEVDAEHFDDLGGIHTDSINRLAEVGIASGCSDSLVAFCPYEPVERWQAAMFVARTMELVEPVELAPLDERRELQAELDAQAEAEAELQRQEEQQLAQQTTSRGEIWDALAECESNGNWQINTGNGYYGGLQFSLSSWRAVGGSGYPHQHSREEQIHRGELLLDLQGWGAWPACSLKLNYR